MRNYLSEMLNALTSAYSRKDYDNQQRGFPLETVHEVHTETDTCCEQAFQICGNLVDEFLPLRGDDQRVHHLTSAYSRKDYDNQQRGFPLETKIGKLFAVFAWGLNMVQEQAEKIKAWDNLVHPSVALHGKVPQ